MSFRKFLPRGLTVLLAMLCVFAFLGATPGFAAPTHLDHASANTAPAPLPDVLAPCPATLTDCFTVASFALVTVTPPVLRLAIVFPEALAVAPYERLCTWSVKPPSRTATLTATGNQGAPGAPMRSNHPYASADVTSDARLAPRVLRE